MCIWMKTRNDPCRLKHTNTYTTLLIDKKYLPILQSFWHPTAYHEVKAKQPLKWLSNPDTSNSYFDLNREIRRKTAMNLLFIMMNLELLCTDVWEAPFLQNTFAC